MKFVISLILLVLMSIQAPAATWYVSNAANNGYASGSDGNDGTTTKTPFLTIAQADIAASAGDLINVNPSGSAYEEAMGSLGYLSVDKTVTLQTDPSLLSAGKALVRPSMGADRPMQCAANGIVLQDLVIDANNTFTLSQGVTFRSEVVAITLRRCDFINFPAAATFCLSTSITNGNLLLDRCTAKSANGVDRAVTFLDTANIRPNVSVTILGCNVSGIRGVFLQNGLISEPYILTCDSAPDGTRNTFSNLSSCITWGMCPPGTAIAVNNTDLYNIDAEPFSGSGSPTASLPSLLIGGTMVTNTAHNLIANSSGQTIGSLSISGLSYPGASYVVNNAGTISTTRIENSTFAGNSPVIYSQNANMRDVGFAHCRFSSNTTAIYLPGGGDGLSVESCQFNNCTATAIVLSGVFPNILIRSNTLTGPHGLLAVNGVYASNILVDGNSISLVNAAADAIAVIGSSGVEISNNRILSDAEGYHGIIVGTDGYYLFASNSGPTTSNNLGDSSSDAWIAQPWTMAESSSYSSRIMASFTVSAKKAGNPTGTIAAFLYGDFNGIPGSLLATSSISVNASALSSSTTRPLEFWFDTPYTLSYSTTYWIVLQYTGTANGVDYVVLDSNTTGSRLHTSAGGSSWSSSSNALIYNIYHGNYECVNPLVHDNYIACSTPLNSLEGVHLGGVTGGQVYRNQVYGGGWLLVAKLMDGVRTPCLFYDNLVFEYSGSQEALRSKGSRSVQFLHNTVVMNGTGGAAVTLDNNFTLNSYNGHPSVNAVVRNNIFYAYSLPGSGILYSLGATGFISPTCVAPTIDHNLVFCGSGLAYFGVDASDGAKETDYASWSSWQEAGFDARGRNADPLLSNSSNPRSPTDFMPAQSSPAIGVGADVLASVPTDFYGVNNSAMPTVGAIQPSHAPPTITTQPSNQTAVAGTSAGFQVSAAGTAPLSYQWMFNGVPLAGATDAALNLANVQTTQAGSYGVVVTNVSGAITSSLAQLTVFLPPVITMQPINQTVGSGANVTFDVAASGTPPLSYQWFFNGTGLVGAGGTTLSLSDVQPSQAGSYSVIASSPYGSASSIAATLTVLMLPTIITQPSNQTVVAGTSASFQVSAAGTAPLSYQWIFDGAPLAGATDATLNLANVQTTQAGSYGVVVTNVSGATTSNWAQLTVFLPPAIIMQPINQAVGSGANVTFDVAASGTPPLSYQWFFNGTGLVGAGGTTLSLSDVQPSQAGSYSVIASSPYGSVSSIAATLTVLMLPTIITQPSNQTVVAGTSASFQVSAAGTAPLSYQWIFDGAPLAGATDATLNLANVQTTQAGSYGVVVTNVSGATTSSWAQLTVFLPPAIIMQPINQAVGSGANVTFDVAASGTPPLSYQWFFNGTGLVGAGGTTLSLSDVQPSQAGSYSVIASSPYGSVSSIAATLTVLMLPTIITQPSNQTVVAGTSASFQVSAAGTAPLSYQWIFDGTNLSGAVDTNLNLISIQSSQAGFYSVVVANSAGSITSTVAQLMVLEPSDTNRPTFYASEFDENGLPVVSVTFSKLMDLASISRMGNYSIVGASIVGIAVGTNSSNESLVQFQLAGEPTSLPVTLTITGITDYSGNAPSSSSVSMTFAGLINADIGDPTIPDPAWPGYMWNYAPGAFTVMCEGSDIGGWRDGFNFSYESKTNDFDVVVRQVSFIKSDNNSRGGLMIREDLTPYSRNWNIVNDPASGDGMLALDGSGIGANTIECNCRSTNGINGAISLSWATGPTTVPNYSNAWLRLKRTGQVLQAYWSTNADPSSSWTQEAMTDISTNANGPLPAVLYVGIACTAHVNDPVAATVLKYPYEASFANYNSAYVAPTNTLPAKPRQTRPEPQWLNSPQTQ